MQCTFSLWSDSVPYGLNDSIKSHLPSSMSSTRSSPAPIVSMRQPIPSDVPTAPARTLPICLRIFTATQAACSIRISYSSSTVNSSSRKSGGLSPWNANSYTAKSSVKTWSWFYNFGFCLWRQFVYPYIVVLFKVLSVSRGHIVECTNFIQLTCSFR